MKYTHYYKEYNGDNTWTLWLVAKDTFCEITYTKNYKVTGYLTADMSIFSKEVKDCLSFDPAIALEIWNWKELKKVLFAVLKQAFALVTNDVS